MQSSATTVMQQIANGSDWQPEAPSSAASAMQWVVNEFPQCIVIKNTFVDMMSTELPTGMPRSKSEPALLHCPQQSGEQVATMHSTTARPPLALVRIKAASEESTNGSSEIFPDDLDSISEPTSLFPSSRAPSLGSLGSGSEGIGTLVSGVDVPALEASVRTCTSLNSSAAPFQPRSLSAQHPILVVLPREFAPPPARYAEPKDFYDAVEQIVRGMARKVECSMKIPIHAHVISEYRGWSIIFRIREADIHHQDMVIQYAKAEMLCFVEGTEFCKLLPCCSELFKPKLRGFGATLSFMQDRSTACWDMYATGQCCREYKCRWQHPLYKQRLFVAVKNLTEQYKATGDCS